MRVCCVSRLAGQTQKKRFFRTAKRETAKVRSMCGAEHANVVDFSADLINLSKDQPETEHVSRVERRILAKHSNENETDTFKASPDRLI